MDTLTRRIHWEAADAADALLTREWLVTNGLGGYATGTLAGVATRRYHGLLVAALPNPLGRTVMLNHLSERVRLADGSVGWLAGEERADGALELGAAQTLTGFRLETGLPVWEYRVGGARIEKRVLMPYRQNTVFVRYRLLEAEGPVRLNLRPAVHFRPHEAPVSQPLAEPYVLRAVGERLELSAAGGALPPLRLRLDAAGGAFTLDGRRLPELLYRVEESRGYEHSGDLWSPGYFRADLAPGADVTLVASTEEWDTLLALAPEDAPRLEGERRERLLALAVPAARSGPAAELVLAADQFIVTPGYRTPDAARARAAGDEVRTVIAGYHWFTDWGRDTMIALEGLTLTTGRHREAAYILRTFGHYVRDGLLPNMFPDGSSEGVYHTADATLWFFHALDRYVQATGDQGTLDRLLPTLREILDRHLEGTRFGIGVDPADGLLRQGEEGYQLTWMDAKCGDWVVTPRRGKAVEINALWYNALCLLDGWLRVRGEYDAAARIAERAQQVYASFNRRFWYAEGGYLYDVVDGEAGDDAACRPNQLFALSLRNPVLAREHWVQVLAVVRARLLTPVGLRSLSTEHPDYKPTYRGDLRTRDAAYHQGTVWAWLIGPFVDAWLKVHPGDRAGARALLDGLVAHLDDFGVGSVAEVFDAEPPFTPRGCIAQAWSVAELLRCLVLTER